jgi:hypothetical protein
MKTLRPALPTDVKEIADKGFLGNISKHEKFITDGHSMILASAVRDGFEIKLPDEGLHRSPALSGMQTCWDAANDRKTVHAHFIGCGHPGEMESLVAVIRDDNGRILIVDPYILKFALSSVKGDEVHISEGPKYDVEPLAIFHGLGIVALVMPMRYTRDDLKKYDLTTDPVDIRTL